ncbi:MAG TPA: hypothetical protein VGU43_00875 [Thermoplasmata archaeon]|nr:hypothetical protein [Thermoplasmata archaeon]
MELPAGYTWVESPKGAPGSRIGLILGPGLFAAFEGELLVLNGLGAFVRAAEFAPVHGGSTLTFLIYFLGATAAGMLLVARQIPPTSRVGVGDPGLALVAGSRVRLVPWKALRPSPVPPTPPGNWAGFGTADAKGQLIRGFFASKEQTRLILGHRNFPARDFPGGYWTWAGLPDPYAIPLSG